MLLSTITTQGVVVRAAASCGDEYYASVAVNYCASALANLPACTVDTPACCASHSSYASKGYMCMSKYATECGPAKTNYLENLGSQAKACTWFGGAGTPTTLIVTNLPSETVSGKAPTATATAGAGSGTTSAKATGSSSTTGTQQSVAAQSSATAATTGTTTTKSSSGSRVNGGLGTMGVVSLVGGISIFFLGGGL